MHIFINLRIPIYIYIYIYSGITQVYLCEQTHTHTHYTHTHTHTHTHIYIYIYVCVRVCVDKSMCIKIVNTHWCECRIIQLSRYNYRKAPPMNEHASTCVYSVQAKPVLFFIATLPIQLERSSSGCC